MTADNAAGLLQAGGPWVALLSVLLAGLQQIRTGGLVPRATLDLMIAQYEARIAESREREQQWRSAADLERLAGQEQREQLGELIPLARTSVAILQSLPKQ